MTGDSPSRYIFSTYLHFVWLFPFIVPIFLTLSFPPHFPAVFTKMTDPQGGQKYRAPGRIYTEGDASSASYFLAGAALTGGKWLGR